MRNHDLPPGQVWTDDWPVVHEGQVPRVATGSWTLRAWGQIRQPVEWSWERLLALPQDEVSAPLHSARGWSRRAGGWRGLTSRALLGRIELLPSAGFVMLHGLGGYTAGLPLSVFAGPGVVFARELDGAPLAAEHGGPLRLVVPGRFGWKWVKWVQGIELLSKPWPDTGEQRGLPPHASPDFSQGFELRSWRSRQVGALRRFSAEGVLVQYVKVGVLRRGPS